MGGGCLWSPLHSEQVDGGVGGGGGHLLKGLCQFSHRFVSKTFRIPNIFAKNVVDLFFVSLNTPVQFRGLAPHHVCVLGGGGGALLLLGAADAQMAHPATFSTQGGAESASCEICEFLRSWQFWKVANFCEICEILRLL